MTAAAPGDSSAPDLQALLRDLRRDLQFTTRLRGRDLRFSTAWGLFSPRAVDEGTRLLLDHVEVNEDDDCIDLGCGYGAIGVTLASLAPRGETWLVDRDFVAVDHARRNVATNGLTNCTVVLSDSFSAVPPERRFDLVASNLPAKAGNEALTLLLAEAHEHLAEGGRCYVVTLSGMRRFIERTMRGIYGNYRKVKQGRQHTVALAVREASTR